MSRSIPNAPKTEMLSKATLKGPAHVFRKVNAAMLELENMRRPVHKRTAANDGNFTCCCKVYEDTSQKSPQDPTLPSLSIFLPSFPLSGLGPSTPQTTGCIRTSLAHNFPHCEKFYRLKLFSCNFLQAFPLLLYSNIKYNTEQTFKNAQVQQSRWEVQQMEPSPRQEDTFQNGRRSYTTDKELITKIH